MQINIEMDGKDFERLTSNSTSWSNSWSDPGKRADGVDVSWRTQVDEGRFEHTEGAYDDEPKDDWHVAYWVSSNWSDVMLCRAFLKANGYEYEILIDLATAVEGTPDKPGRLPDYVILTDYLSPVWHKNEVKGTLSDNEK
jgi:hypothetical protein